MSHRKPTALKKLEGNPGKQRLNDAEPDFDAIVPDRPLHLDAAAKKYWKELAPIVHRAKLLTEGDQLEFAMLCQTAATLAKATRAMNQKPLVSEDSKGIPRVNPHFDLVMKATAKLITLCGEFGLSPAARSRVRVDVKRKSADSVDEAFNGGAELLVLPKRGTGR